MSDDQQWSEEACLAALERAADELEHQPRVGDYRSLDILPSANGIIATFGSWNAAIRAAGWEPLDRQEHHPNWRHVDDDPPEERE